MRAAGFQTRSLGSNEDHAKAEALRLNAEWDARRSGAKRERERFKPGMLGFAYCRIMKHREDEREKNGTQLTFEQRRRADWPRAWRWIGPAFGDVPPARIKPEDVSNLRSKIVAKTSETEAHRTIKVFRALWKLLPAFNVKVAADADPAKAIRNRAPDARQAVWQYYEVLQLVQGAWREGYYGLAALIAVAWETMMSPIDVRTLSAGQRKRDFAGSYFGVARAKTGRAAAGTLERYAEAMLDAYLRKLTTDGTIALHDRTPLFWTRGGAAVGSQGGRPWKPAPYSMDKLGKDFRKVRAIVFGPDETRQLADLRRSGAVEADVGGVNTSDLAHKMANRVDTADFIRKTYTPVNLPAVRRVSKSREQARKSSRTRKGEE